MISPDRAYNVLTPHATQLPARRLLLVGLGDPARLSLEALGGVGRVAVREAIKLEEPSFCFAPSLKDAGFGGFPAADVSTALALGMVSAIATAQALAERGLTPPLRLAGGQRHVVGAGDLRARLLRHDRPRSTSPSPRSWGDLAIGGATSSAPRLSPCGTLS